MPPVLLRAMRPPGACGDEVAHACGRTLIPTGSVLRAAGLDPRRQAPGGCNRAGANLRCIAHATAPDPSRATTGAPMMCAKHEHPIAPDDARDSLRTTP